MSKVTWTSDQQKVIDYRDRNILVSAAAGSGKTAVLVERIIKMVTDESKPVNIDELLVVTFTKAAAAQMKERIREAIEKEIENNPENRHLQRQVLLLHNAQITTIDSFCLNVVKNYFSTIDLNPCFRIADENELSLLKADVISDVLENWYAKKDEGFLDLIEKYSLAKSDKNIEEMILKLYNYSRSNPWPEEWLRLSKSMMSYADEDEFEESVIIKTIMQQVAFIVKDIKDELHYAIEICNMPDGPETYIQSLEGDINICDYILGCNTYKGIAKELAGLSFIPLSRKKTDATVEKKDMVKAIRKNAKDALEKLRKRYFYQDISGMLHDIEDSRVSMEALILITLDFSKEYAKAKEEKNILDFSDIEHFALEILIDRKEDTDGSIADLPSEVADSLSNYYAEILIDEYQDSNFVQEAILTSVSKERFGKCNVFMVGDVKQSIYRFRMARPELFMEKYNTYTLEESKYQRIDLKKNFRSRKVVLDGINYICEQIMTKKLGGIEYDEEAALYNGMDYPTDDERYSDSCEMILFDKSFMNEAMELEDDEADEKREYSKKESEALILAKKIKEITNPKTGLLITSKDENGDSISKIAGYSDIAILFRGVASWAEILMEVFASEGIPIFIESQTGYFSAIEVRNVINLLKIINNPRQDIPLAGVMLSRIGGFTNNDMAYIRANSDSCDLYQALMNVKIGINIYEINDNIALPIQKKAENFIQMLERYRRMVPYMAVHELIQKLITETGYYDYVYAMPNGERRRMNLDMLVEKALTYEETSYKGLFNFVRYIERMNKYDIDFGEATDAKGSEECVRVMTIHKSKGLEFPVVFVAGMGQKFNVMDTRDKILIHSEYGLAPDYIDSSARLKSPTLIKSLTANIIAQENIAEELRILYVALTRAREKLILTGYVSDIDETVKKQSSILGARNKEFSFEKLCRTTSYMDLVIPALIRHGAFDSFLDNIGIDRHEMKMSSYISKYADCCWKVSVADKSVYISDTLVEKINKLDIREKLYRFNKDIVYNQKMKEYLERKRGFSYRYANQIGIKSKVTVSEIKKAGQYETEDIPLPDMTEEIKEKNIPEFMKDTKDEPLSGSLRGTAYHKVMELLRLEEANSIKEVKTQIHSMQTSGRLTKEQADCIDAKEIYEFASSEIADRIKNADKMNNVYREKQFLIGVDAAELMPEGVTCETKELILVQGVIDIYFEEDGEIVLLDYKTDRVGKNNGKNILIDRYHKQLEYYQKAIEQLTAKKVKARYIYSFALAEYIML